MKRFTGNNSEGSTDNNREAFQAAEQFLLRGYIPPLGGLGGECNEVDFGDGLNEVRVKPGDKRHLIARVRFRRSEDGRQMTEDR